MGGARPLLPSRNGSPQHAPIGVISREDAFHNPTCADVRNFDDVKRT